MIHTMYKYESAAKKSYCREFINKEKILSIANEAQLTDENKKLLSDFMDFADEETKEFMWLFYYFQFETDENFYKDIWQLDTIPMPELTEEKFPGCIKACVYLLAAQHLKKWVKDHKLSYSIVEGYYHRYRYFVSLNMATHNTQGLCRLSPFLYGYSKPFMLCIGRLSYQYTTFKDYCEVYENSRGEKLFVALPHYNYNTIGHIDKTGKTPQYTQTGNILTAHTYDEKGCLTPHTTEIDLTRYKRILKPGDNVVTIHIPDGDKLNMEDVEKSLIESEKIFKKHFPQYKAIVCYTWFIDPGLRGTVIKEGSNMASFADLFQVICTEDNENHSVYEHVFRVKKQPLKNLVPQNAFQERVLNNALKGNKIYWSLGVLKKTPIRS